MSKISIIGSGFGGLSTAALLAKDGHDVTVFEKNTRLGGRAMTFDSKGYHFDMGPSWYLMNEVFENYFKQFGKDIHDYVDLIPLDPMYRMYFSPDEHIDIVRDLQKNLELFESLEKGAGENIQRYLKGAEEQYNLAINHFLYQHFETVFDFIKPELFSVGNKANVFQSLEKHINNFTRDPRLKKILGYTMVFLGGAPNNTPALYSLMSHVDYNLGVYYPMGGFGALADAFVKLAEEEGVKFKPNHTIKKLHVKDGKVDTIITNNKTYTSDIVISNADYHHTETQLLDKEYQTHPAKYWQKATLAPSAYIIHLGIKGRVKGLQHHNLILTHDWEQHFNEIFDKPSWPEKPSYYVSCPTKTDSTLAPKGCDLLFILVPVASGLRDATNIRNRYYKKIMEDLEKHTGDSIQDRIVTKRIYSHKDFRNDYNAYKGTALGLAHTLKQTAIFRPKNKSKKVKNLYFVGQYTQPGIGVPIAVISGELTSKRVQKEHGK